MLQNRIWGLSVHQWDPAAPPFSSGLLSINPSGYTRQSIGASKENMRTSVMHIYLFICQLYTCIGGVHAQFYLFIFTDKDIQTKVWRLWSQPSEH